ncbi:MAG: hypothetical protein ACTHMU_03195 [Thermomicrobiales bacterium]
MNGGATVGGAVWVVLLVVVVGALLVLCDTLLPNLMLRARQNAATWPVRSFFVGLINIGFFGLLALALLAPRRPGLALLGVLLGSLVLALIGVGGTALARLLGDRLRPASHDPLRRLLAGAVALELALLTPVVGWFLLTPIVCCVGGGAVIIALVRRQPTVAPPAAPPPAERPTAPLPADTALRQ